MIWTLKKQRIILVVILLGIGIAAYLRNDTNEGSGTTGWYLPLKLLLKGLSIIGKLL
jgi:hypothetical protein